ncbi:heme ABC exporter ATP-binding protein CcmA [Parasulfitobacter algicola]|uniref:Heme ABC exporter ATP-binding protein CcmA n=1 Tax=Parasulfitobacter algicola TaxID=2614809 RepID=A0ABX2IWD1_9RHOB|nr:heme ABC exporter ATP-binding protein CcmA [Sulfitobacter algicola]NSX55192.1 heme ABC exporter ATP-binding protein CcmA [Sulfitobacter algicola]
MELRLTDIACARGGMIVLDGVTFALASGQALMLRGPNGIGKTTLLRVIAGLQPAVSGQIDGADEQIAYAGHADGLKATLTVSENLQFWAKIYGTSGIDDAIAAFDLTMLIDRRAHDLSAGQKRRLGLARLLVTGRRIWALDEPTVSLDAISVGLFADAVRAHCAGGGMVLMATHIDLGLQADTLDLTPYKAAAAVETDFDEAFL